VSCRRWTFLLPIVFFSIFATVFGGRQGGTPRSMSPS
jgi:hypothetical protein